MQHHIGGVLHRRTDGGQNGAGGQYVEAEQLKVEYGGGCGAVFSMFL